MKQRRAHAILENEKARAFDSGQKKTKEQSTTQWATRADAKNNKLHQELAQVIFNLGASFSCIARIFYAILSQNLSILVNMRGESPLRGPPRRCMIHGKRSGVGTFTAGAEAVWLFCEKRVYLLLLLRAGRRRRYKSRLKNTDRREGDEHVEVVHCRSMAFGSLTITRLRCRCSLAGYSQSRRGCAGHKARRATAG
jgi:hypothetical protein